jgi:hypothetical protein
VLCTEEFPNSNLSSDDSFLWKSSPEDLQNFVNAVLDIEDDSKGELKEDKKHNAFTYKLNDISVRFYITTGTRGKTSY